MVRYNALAEVRSGLDSLLALGGEGLEIILVDNASPEGGVEVLEREYPSVTLIKNSENVGFARAVNQAAGVATGRLLFLFNPDSYLIPGNPAVEILADRLEADPAMGAAGPRLVNPDGSLQTSAYAFPTLFQSAGHLLGLKKIVPLSLLHWLAPAALKKRFGQLSDHQSERPVDYCTGAALMVKTQAWQEVDGLDERFFLYYEEKDLCLRLRRRGYSTWLIPQARVGHRIGASSDTAPETARLARYQSMLDYFAKNLRGKLPILVLMLRAAAAWKNLWFSLRGREGEAALWRRIGRLKPGRLRPGRGGQA